MPGNNWYYRLRRQIEITIFLINNFMFDSKSLLQIAQQLRSKQKPEFNNTILLKIITDFTIFDEILEDSKSKTKKPIEKMRQYLKKIIYYLSLIVYEKSKTEKQPKFVEFLNDPYRLNSPINPKDRIWINSEESLLKIEKYTFQFLVW